MATDIWINLPVRDVKKSKEFFTKLGFAFDTKYGDTETTAGMRIGDKKVVVMLIVESSFKQFVGNTISDTKQGNEVLFSLGAASRQEVDDMAKKAEEAGGTVFGKPGEHSDWMYGCGFTDLDGHRWNALYMDMSKMPK